MFHLTVETPDDCHTLDISPDQHARRLTDVLRRARIPLNTRCGQRGLCDGCMVQLSNGLLLDAQTHAKLEPGSQDGLLHGCRILVPESGTATVRVPARSLLAHQPQVVTSFRLNVPRAQDPLWQIVEVNVRQLPERTDLVAELRRIAEARLGSGLPIRVTPGLAECELDAADSLVCFVEHRGDHWLLGRLQNTLPAYGVAVDVGTTTVVVALVELTTGRIVGSASALNAQARMGDNVLTRINACITKRGIVERFQAAVVKKTLNPLLKQAAQEADIAMDQLVCVVVAGNMTMLHLLADVDPSSMGTAPFTPTFLDHRVESSVRLGLEFAEDLSVGADADVQGERVPQPVGAGEGGPRPRPVHLLPGSAAYVGADITAGVLASGMAYHDTTCLLVDLGTNGEIVLKHGDALIGCATAAGPAFEGAGLTHGVRAGRGAISHVWIDTNPLGVRTEVIDDVSPIGVCGTAYIDLLARARQTGLIGPTGRFDPGCQSDVLIKHRTHGRALVVAAVAAGEPLLITEADIATLLQAKAAIAAGIICLLRRVQLLPTDIETVYVAGGFGFHMHVDSLIGSGMLPGFAADQVAMVGNTSLAGAYLTLLDAGALDSLNGISRKMQVVELNLEPDFEGTYIDQLILPD